MTEEYWNRRTAGVRTALAKKRAAIERTLNERKSAWAEKRKAAQARSILEHQRKLIELDAQHARNLEILESHGVFAQELKGRIANFTRERGVRLRSARIGAGAGATRANAAVAEEQLVDDPNETAPTPCSSGWKRLWRTRLRGSMRLGPIVPPVVAYFPGPRGHGGGRGGS